jgi:hypothetical protein
LNVSVGDGGAVCERWDRMSGSALDKSQHVGCGLAKVFIGGDLWERDFVREPIDSERVANTAGAGDVALVASVMFRGGADVPTVDAMRAHVGTLGGCEVHDDTSSRRGEGTSVEIESAVEAGIG